MELTAYKKWLETVRNDNTEFRDALSYLLSSNNYQDQDGSVELAFLFSYENGLLSNEELRHFYILLHQRYKPYQFLETRIVEIIRSLSPLPILDYWAEMERKKWFDNLGDSFEIYRGLSIPTVDFSNLGLCWSTSIKKAKEFCRGNGALLSAKCYKEDVLCFFQGTDEHEVVIPADKTWSVTARPYTTE